MAKNKSVQVRSSQIRSTPSFLGKIVGTVQYGDSVQVSREDGSWVKVKRNGVEGWMHGSALTAKKIVVNPGGAEAASAASGDELALAGKGFNKQVEDKFRQKNKNLNFALVDRLESIVISQQEIENFLQTGSLHPKRGEA